MIAYNKLQQARPQRLLGKILRGMGWVSLLSISQMVVNLALTVALARLLTPYQFGEFTLALVIISFLQIFSQLGINAAVVQIKVTSDAFFSTAFTLVASVSIFLTVFGVIGITIWLDIFSDAASNSELLSALRVLLLSLPFFSIADFYQGILNRNLNFRAPAAISLLSYVIGYAAISLVLALLGFGAYALIIAYVGQHVIRALVLYASLKGRPGVAFLVSDVKRILNFGIGFTIAKLGNNVALQVDNLIVANYLGNAALGLYSRSYQLVMSPISLITTVVDRVLFAAMSRRQENTATLRWAFLLLNTVIFSFFVPISIIVFEFSAEITFVVLGGAWAKASEPLAWLGVGLSFRAAYRLSDIVCRSIGLVYTRAVVQWVYASCVILGGIVGTNWGLKGVVIGVTGAIAINWILMTAITLHSLSISTRNFLTSFLPVMFPVSTAYLIILILNYLLGRGSQHLGSPMPPIATAAIAILSAVITWRFFKTSLYDFKLVLVRAKNDN